MRKFLILAVLVGATAFTAISLASSGSGDQVALPGKAKTLDAHRMSTAAGNVLGLKASAKRSRFGLVYLFADINNLAADETDGGRIRCPRKFHPVSGLFFTESDEVVTATDAPVSTRAWAVFVRNEGGSPTSATVGAVCEKGLRITPP
jgi:hypothetical protein